MSVHAPVLARPRLQAALVQIWKGRGQGSKVRNLNANVKPLKTPLYTEERTRKVGQAAATRR